MVSRILLFDIDGTLLRTGGAGQEAMEEALSVEFQVPTPIQNIPTAGRTDRGIENDVFDRYGIEPTDENRRRFMEGYLQRLPHSLQHLQGGLLPGVVELLQALSERDDTHLTLLTGNYERGAWIKIRHFGLDRFFVDGTFGDFHANRDDLAVLARTKLAEQLQRELTGAELMVIGDTPADIRCARAVGASVAAVATGIYDAEQLRPHQPDLLFADLSQTQDVLAQLLDH
jgi:phosphoglycolate phosphatase